MFILKKNQIMNKEISIIIATWNAAKTLEVCLNSIVAQLTDEIELIIIDGGSTDKTNEIINSYGDQITKHISEPDKGIYDAWNKGVKIASGNWIAFVGADDILLPHAIQTYLNVIKETKNINEYDYICARNEYVDANGKLLKMLGEKPTWKKMRHMMVAAHVASLHNKQRLFNSLGGYNLDFRICADYELLLRKRNNLNALFISDAQIARMKVGGMSFSTKAIIEVYKIRKLHHSLPPLINEIYFFRDWCAYKFFKIRNTISVSSLMHNLITNVKGENYIIDPKIPSTYLIKLTFQKAIAMAYGIIRFRTCKKIFVSPSAKIICSSKIKFGRNLNIGYGCYINALSKNGLICGENVSIGYHTYIALTGSLHNLADKMVIGNNVGLGTHGCYGVGVGKLEIGDNTICGNYVSIHPENHITERLDIPIRLQGVKSNGGVKIGKNCWIGAKVTILDGTEIGDGCIIAAGAVVKGKFPNNSIIGGVPAKIIKMRN